MAKCLTFAGLFGMLAIAWQLAAAPHAAGHATLALKSEARAR